jgi:hypothetical protein
MLLHVIVFLPRSSKNQTLSESFEDILAAQGVTWLTRKALTHSKLTLKIKHDKDSENVERIEIEQNVAGLRSTQEIRILDWTEREHQNLIWGDVIGKSKRSKVSDLVEEYLQEGWSEDTVQHGVVYSHARSDTSKTSLKWVTNQVRQKKNSSWMADTYTQCNYGITDMGFFECEGS